MIDSLPCFYFYVYSRLIRNVKWAKNAPNKMDNPTFVNEEDIPMVNEDEDYYDNYRTPNTSRLNEASFTAPDTAEATSMLRLRQKVKQGKINALYRHLNVTGNPDLIDFDRFSLTKDAKKGATIFEFYNDDRWARLTK